MYSFEPAPMENKGTNDSENGLNSSNSYDEITLEYVSGVSTASKNAIALNKSSGNVAFIASSVLALFDPRYSHQAFIENPSSREIRSVTFSDDGRFLAFGENGVNPSVSVYNAKLFTHINRFQVEERKCAIKSLRFHPRSIYLTLLLAHDYTILVYDFVHGRKLAAARWCVEPLAMTMTKTESILAVCGHRKISCFSLSNVESTRYETNAMLDKRAVLLGKQGNYTFVDITSGQAKHIKSLYTVTACGYLCEIQTRGIFINHVVRISERCFCVGFELGMLFVGCEKGVVSLCNPSDLTVIANVSDHDMFGNDKLHPMHWDVKSDIIALVVNPKTRIVTTLMSDQKMHSWSVDFGKNAVECSPVISVDVDNKSCPMSKVITSHDMQCTLAQLLLQLELRNNKQNEACSFLQRPSSFSNKKINAIKISPDGKEIIVGTKEGEIKIYEATSGRLTRVIEAHSAEVTFIDMMYDDDFQLVATGGRDRLLFILDAAKAYKHVQTINDHSSAIVSISLAHNKGVLTLISSSADGVILIRRAGKEGKPVFNIVGELPEFVGCKKRVYNHSSGYIITGQERGRINVFPADPKINLKPMRKLQVGNALLKTVTIDPTGSFFIACSKEGQYVFHLQSGQQIATLCTIPGFHHLSFSQDLNYFINSNDAGCKFLWRLPSKVVDVMKVKMSNSQDGSESNPCEFFYNSYESYYRVCQQLVKQEETANKEKSDRSDLKNDDHCSYRDAKPIGCSLEDRLRLVESESFTSCTTYSRSLTDLTQGMDISGEFGQPPPEKQSAEDGEEDNRYLLAQSGSEIFANNSPRENSSGGTVISIVESGLHLGKKNRENKVEQVSSTATLGQADHQNILTPNASPIPCQALHCSNTTIIGDNQKSAEKEMIAEFKISTPSRQSSRTNLTKHHPFQSEGQLNEIDLKCGFHSNKSKQWNRETQSVSDDEAERCPKVVAETKVKNQKAENSVVEVKVLKHAQEREEKGENLSENENITVDSGVMSPTSSTTIKQSDVFSPPKPNNSHERQPPEDGVKGYNNRYKTIQLSNSQETYVMKNVDLYTSISIINGLTTNHITESTSNELPEELKLPRKSLKSLAPLNLKSARRATSPESSKRDAQLFGSMSNVDAGDSEIYCQDFYLRKVLLSWALKKLHKERMRRKMKSITQEKTMASHERNAVRAAPVFVPSSPETSTESQPTGTSELSDISDISACAMVISSNSTLTDSDANNVSRLATNKAGTFIIGQKQQSGDPLKSSIKSRAKVMMKSPAICGKSTTGTKHRSPDHHCSKTEFQLSPLRLNALSKTNSQSVVSYRQNTPSPMNSLKASQQGNGLMGETNARQHEEKEITIPDNANGAMADLFRSQDNYLRKLKEVRQNFEKSIQALSAERESQRLEAQKYLGKPLF